MFRKILPLVALSFFGLLTTLQAQENPPAGQENAGDSPQNNRFWQASVGGGHYMVALERISAISRHQYVLDGSLLVDEVTVDALGQSLVRFYFITPITDEMTGTGMGAAASRMVDRARELSERGSDVTGVDIQHMVVKKFPETTHAKQIEFRVLSEQQLTALYKSVRTAWESGRGRKFSAK